MTCSSQRRRDVNLRNSSSDECAVTNLFKAFVQLDRSQCRAVLKCFFTDCLDRCRNFDLSERFAVREKRGRDVVRTLAESHINQGGAVLKRTACVGQRGRDVNFRNDRVTECTVAELFKTFVQRDSRQLFAISKRIFVNRRHTFRNHDGFNARPPECIAADCFHGLRNRDCFQTCAAVEQTLRDMCDAFAEGDLVQILASVKRHIGCFQRRRNIDLRDRYFVERVIIDLRQAFVQRDRQKTFAGVECIFVDQRHVLRDRNRGQCTPLECIGTNRLDSLRDRDGCQTVASLEHTCRNLGNALTESDLVQILASVKRHIGCFQCRRNIDLRDRYFVERVIIDLCQSFVQRDRQKVLAGVECIFVNQRHTCRNDNRFQSALLERLASDFRDSFRDRNGSQRFYAVEQSLCNHGRAFSKGNLRQLGTFKRHIGRRER